MIFFGKSFSIKNSGTAERSLHDFVKRFWQEIPCVNKNEVPTNIRIRRYSFSSKNGYSFSSKNDRASAAVERLISDLNAVYLSLQNILSEMGFWVELDDSDHGHVRLLLTLYGKGEMRYKSPIEQIETLMASISKGLKAERSLEKEVQLLKQVHDQIYKMLLFAEDEGLLMERINELNLNDLFILPNAPKDLSFLRSSPVARAEVGILLREIFWQRTLTGTVKKYSHSLNRIDEKFWLEGVYGKENSHKPSICYVKGQLKCKYGYTELGSEKLHNDLTSFLDIVKNLCAQLGVKYKFGGKTRYCLHDFFVTLNWH